MTQRSTDRLPWMMSFGTLLLLAHLAALSLIGTLAWRRLPASGLSSFEAALLTRNEFLFVTGDPAGRQFSIRSIDIRSGREQLTDFPVLLPWKGWVTDGNRQWMVGESTVVEIDGTNRTEHKPRRKLSGFFGVAFLYEGSPAIIVDDGVYRLLVLADGEWEDRGEVALPGVGRRWAKTDSGEAERLVPLSESPRSSSTALPEFVTVISVDQTLHLFHTDGASGVVAYREGIEFVDRDHETPSAFSPCNIPADATGWKKLEFHRGLRSQCRSRDGLLLVNHSSPKEPIQFWEQTPPGSDQPFRLVKEIVTGQWETLMLVSSLDGRDVYFIRDRNLLGPRILRYEQGELKELALHLDTPIAQLFRWAKGVLAQVAVVLALGTILLACGAIWISRSQEESYQFGHDTVRLAPLGRRCVARGIDLIFVFAPLIIQTLISWPHVRDEDLFRLFWGSGESEQAFTELFHTLRPVALASMTFFVVLIWTQSRWGLTPGKWLCGLRTLRTTLRPCGFARALLRELLMAIDAPLFLTPLPGVTSMLATECRQRLGDLAADTLVINVRRYTPSVNAKIDRGSDVGLVSVGQS